MYRLESNESHRSRVVNSTAAPMAFTDQLTVPLRLRLASTLKNSTAAENTIAK
jgi:hypothetical protein